MFIPHSRGLLHSEKAQNNLVWLDYESQCLALTKQTRIGLTGGYNIELQRPESIHHPQCNSLVWKNSHEMYF